MAGLHVERDALRWGVKRAAMLLAAAVAGSALAAAGSGPTAKIDRSKIPIDVDSGASDIDAKTHLVHLRRGVKITQADISVSADEAQATGLDFSNTKWIFTGKVHIRAESQGDLRSDTATVEFKNNVLARAYVTGSPAQFEQIQSTTGLPAKGHASNIDYDVVGGTIKLTGEAWLFDGPHKMEAPSITYSVRESQIQGDVNPAQGGRVHLTIVPKSDSGSAPDANAGTRKP